MMSSYLQSSLISLKSAKLSRVFTLVWRTTESRLSMKKMKMKKHISIPKMKNSSISLDTPLHKRKSWKVNAKQGFEKGGLIDFSKK